MKNLKNLPNLKSLSLYQAYYDQGNNRGREALQEAVISLLKQLNCRLRTFSFQPLTDVDNSYILTSCIHQLREVESMDLTLNNGSYVRNLVDVLKDFTHLTKFKLISADLLNLSMFEGIASKLEELEVMARIERSDVAI